MNELSGKKLVSIFFSTIMVIIMKNYDDNDEILLKKNQLIMLCIQIILVKKITKIKYFVFKMPNINNNNNNKMLAQMEYAQ